MPLADTFPGAQSQAPRAPGRGLPGQSHAQDAFFDALAGVVVEEPAWHEFDGAIERTAALAIWTWVARDVALGEVERLDKAIASGTEPLAAFDAALPRIIDRLKSVLDAERDDPEAARRNSVQMGGEAARRQLPYVIMAMRKRPLLAQAARFGTAMGVMIDEAAIAHALGSIGINNPLTRALWMQAMVNHMSNPTRAMAAAVSLAGGRDEIRLTHAGFAPLVDAILSHAQAQIGKFASQTSVFADLDYACKAIERFHRLMRALNYNVDIERRSRWGTIVGDLVGKFSARLERPMREIYPSVTQALRRPRDGIDIVDSDQVLTALNGLYLMATVREARDSLAVNALLDQAWTETGQALEVLITRALDTYRANPAVPAARQRLDAGIQMAEIRFNAEYAEILRRARDGAEKRMA